MGEDKIVASVGGKTISEADVSREISRMGQRGQNYNTPQGRAMILEQIINKRLFLLDAQRNLYEREPAFKEQLQAIKEEMLTSYAAQKAIERVRVTEEEVKKYFEENKDTFVSGTNYNASHILVDTEEKASDLLGQIHAGEISFEDAARRFSTCPSGKQGGELGDFTSGQMVPEFENACASMEPGQTAGPVKTQFGYHIIRLNKKEEGGDVQYADIHEELKEALIGEKQQAAYQSKINQLKLLYPVDKM